MITLRNERILSCKYLICKSALMLYLDSSKLNVYFYIGNKKGQALSLPFSTDAQRVSAHSEFLYAIKALRCFQLEDLFGLVLL